MSRPAALALFSLLLVACDDTTGPDGDDTSTPDDTGGGDDDTGDSGTPEKGCITVDGEGGYAYLRDAIRLASEGSTIEICAGKFQEAVTVAKSVTIVGAGSSSTIWGAPEGEAAFRIEGVTGVTLQGIGVSSDVTAIEVQDASDVVLSDLSGSDFGSHAVWARDVEGLVLSDSTFYTAQEGAVLVDGGTAEISGCSLTNNDSYGVAAAGGADVVLRDNTLRGTRYTEKSSGGYSDGFAVIGDRADSLVLEGNRFTDNAVLSVYASGLDTVSLSGDEITNGLFGVYQYQGDLSLDGVTVTNPTEFGVLWVGMSSGSLSVSNSTFYGDPDVVSDYDLDDDVVASIGLYGEGNDITVSDTSVTGWNDAGIWMTSYNAAGGQATLSDVTLEDNGRRGMLLYALDVVAGNVVARNLRAVEEADTSGGKFYVDFPAAVAVEMGSMAWTGGALQDNEGWGISNVLSDVTVSGATFSGNTYSAFMDYQGTSLLEGNTFSASASVTMGLASVWVYENVSTVFEGNLFSSNTGTYTEDLGTMTYVLDGVGTDITAQDSDVELRRNTFENGNLSLYVISSSLLAEGNTWTGYGGADSAIFRVGSGGSSTATLIDTTVDDYGGYLLYCSDSSVSIDGLVATDQGPEVYTYEYWEGGEPYFSDTQSTPRNAFYLTSGCDATLTDVDVQGTSTGTLYAQDSVVRLDGMTIDAPAIEAGYSSDAVFAYWPSKPAEFYATDVSIDAPAYADGLALSVSSSYGTTAMEITRVAVQSAGDSGVSLSGATATVTDAQVTGSVSSGLYASGSTVTVSGGTFSSNGSHGAWFSSCTADVRDATFSDNTGSGLVAGGSTLAAVGNTISGNGEYGISCRDGSTVTECGNAISGNTAGDNDGCDASCDTTP